MATIRRKMGHIIPLEQMKKVARMLRAHEPPILN